ncbi:CYTH domain-containing protein [Candidatus Berkelbacteria bacterium]|nr:CYTH domain-containing protein [Candidatus Berkelbacteria bacterium]
MKQEYEVKILNVNPAELVAKLQELGGKISFGPGLLKTVLFDHPKLKLREQGIPIRVRELGGKAYLNIKHATGPQEGSIKSLEEAQLSVEAFDKMCELIRLAGFYPFRYQEKRRTTFQFSGVRVELDQYPNTPAYLEFEGETPQAAEQLVAKLGYESNQTTKLSATEILKKSGVTNPDLVRFDESSPLPDYLAPKELNSIAEADKQVEEVLWEKD